MGVRTYIMEPALHGTKINDSRGYGEVYAENTKIKVVDDSIHFYWDAKAVSTNINYYAYFRTVCAFDKNQLASMGLSINTDFVTEPVKHISKSTFASGSWSGFHLHNTPPTDALDVTGADFAYPNIEYYIDPDTQMLYVSDTIVGGKGSANSDIGTVHVVVPKCYFIDSYDTPTPSGGGGNEIYISDNGQWVSAEDYISEHGQWPSESE